MSAQAAEGLRRFVVIVSTCIMITFRSSIGHLHLNCSSLFITFQTLDRWHSAFKIGFSLLQIYKIIMDELLIFSEIIPQLEKILEVWQIDVGLLFVGCCKPLGWSTRVYTLDGKWKLAGSAICSWESSVWVCTSLKKPELCIIPLIGS